MKKIMLMMALATSIITNAQVTRVSLKASGLTCSMCSNAINKALKKLDFVETVHADIKTYSFEVSFKPNRNVDFDLIRKKVEGAGFAVSAFYADINFNNARVSAGDPVAIQEMKLLFDEKNGEVLNGNKRVKVMDAGFVQAKTTRERDRRLTSIQTYHVALLGNR